MGKTSRLQDLLEALKASEAEGDDITVQQIQEHLGNSAAGSMLLVLGLILLTPFADIPGIPTVLGVVVVLVGVQLGLGHQQIWLPHFIRSRSLRRQHVHKAISLARPVFGAASVILRERWPRLVTGPAARFICVTCAALALAYPPLEVVPFGATVPSSAITAFGLALVARDGAAALVGLAGTVGGGYLLITWLL